MAKKRVNTASVAEAYMALLKARGIDYIFANGGTDFAPMVEGFAAARAQSRSRCPRPSPSPHENAAIGMAHGYYLATGQACRR